MRIHNLLSYILSHITDNVSFFVILHYQITGGSMHKLKAAYFVSLSSIFFITSLSGCYDDTPEFVEGEPDTTPITSDYDVHKSIKASTFWCGEGASDDNDFITNTESAWDGTWGSQFGLEDHPTKISRDSDFIPTSSSYKGNENPYYFALPFDDMGTLIYDGDGTDKNNASVDSYDRKLSAYSHIYWAGEKSASAWGDATSMCKNRWIKVKKSSNTKWCYAQWEDAGPYYYEDYNYVFGTSAPLNTTDDPYAGIDLSPSVWLYLGEKLYEWGAYDQHVDWTFVDESDVPDGPWKRHVTTRQINW